MVINWVKWISKGIVFLFCIDALVVILTMVAIMQGENVQHVPFWDMQIRFVIQLIS